MNKRQTIIAAAIVIVIALIVALILMNRSFSPFYDEKGEVFDPEFLNELEKAQFGLPAEAEVQILRRDENRQIKVYKVIKQAGDLVTDLNSVQTERGQNP